MYKLCAVTNCEIMNIFTVDLIDTLSNSRWYSNTVGRYLFYFVNALLVAIVLDVMFFPGILFSMAIDQIITWITHVSPADQQSLIENSFGISTYGYFIRFTWAIPSFVLGLLWIKAWAYGTSRKDSWWRLVLIATLATIISSRWYWSLY